MKGIAVSNIAWPVEQDEAVAKALVVHGIRAIEIAPSKLFPKPAGATDADIDACRKKWSDRGLEIVAAQALLFGKPELTLFESKATRGQTADHLKRIIHVCGRLGAKALVFGSPKNRLAGNRNRTEVWAESIEFFRQIGEHAANEGTTVVIEAIPPENGADFVTCAQDAIALVRAVDHPGFRLHLDTACMTLAKDSVTDVVESGFQLLKHFHVSEPQLAPIGGGGVDHAAFARELRKNNYDGWISIEMRETQPFDLNVILKAIELVQQVYGS